MGTSNPLPLADEPGEARPGGLLGGRYLVRRTLKRAAGVIAVFDAEDACTGARVKVKWRPAGASDRWERREAEVLATLAHPRVPRALDAFETPAGRGYVQTYFEGPTPRELLRKLGCLDHDAVVAVLASTLEVLIALEAAPVPVIHRDLNPSNLVCLLDGEVALIDFGIARLGMRDKRQGEVRDLTQAHTVGYAPPEQVIGLEAGPAADLYALGASALYLLSGLHPVRLWDARKGRIVPPPGGDPALSAYLRWLTAPALEDRCPCAGAALEALERLPA